MFVRRYLSPRLSPPHRVGSAQPARAKMLSKMIIAASLGVATALPLNVSVEEWTGVPYGKPNNGQCDGGQMAGKVRSLPSPP